MTPAEIRSDERRIVVEELREMAALYQAMRFITCGEADCRNHAIAVGWAADQIARKKG